MAAEGMMFTDSSADQSYTAGRSSFTTGQSVFRTGMSKVGMPGAKQGISAEDPTIATLIKQQGYATGQFGKNHLGDRNEHLPTVHGYDEFYGSLYHLNASEEPEQRDYPKAGKPFFAWINYTHMHFRTHAKPESLGQSGVAQSEYHDAMIDHDKNVGAILDVIDELGIADNTIVLYSTDNGPHRNSWPDAGMTPFRSEKNTNWEGAYRVPSFARRPGKIKPGSISNEIMSHLDWVPTLVAAAGDTQVKEKLLKGYKANGKSYKVHLGCSSPDTENSADAGFLVGNYQPKQDIQ